MRWNGQELGVEDAAALPGLGRLDGFVRSVQTPEFAGITFHEVLAKSALNKVPGPSRMPFGWTINPYRGCSHACAYCLHPETLILMADGRHKPLSSIRIGDRLIGTERRGAYRRYVETTVSAVWSTRKRAHRVRLADGTEVIGSADHRFLTDRGWKFIRPPESGQRPHLTTNNRLQGFGLGVARTHHGGEDYRRGYLCGMIRGDAMMLRREYSRTGGKGSFVASRFRLALADGEALERSRTFLAREGIDTVQRPFAVGSASRRPMTAIFTSKRAHYDRILDLIAWPAEPSDTWHRGFLAGVFDAEGSCSRGILRISNSDEAILEATRRGLAVLSLDAVTEPARENGVRTIRLRGGLTARRRFFDEVRPAITRKLDLVGDAVTTHADLRVVGIDDLGETVDMIDITTGTGDFIANGVVSHNCFARPTHEYLDLDGGDDFDRQIVVKVNVADVLRRELGRASWQRHPVALGTNTDPYQRAEGRYALMPRIIDELTASRTPFSILTKGTLLRRDLERLADASRHVSVDIAMSIAIYDDALQQSVEHGTPTAPARLATVRAVREAGLDCGVFLMPILPYLTDTRAHLDEALRRASEAGATSVVHTALRLKPGVKEWYFEWLARDHPELLPKYRAMYPGRVADAPKDYRRWLAARIRPLMRAHGLARGEESPVTGGPAHNAPQSSTASALWEPDVRGGSVPPTLF
ncbi:intein-containing Rv2578c family radical SAM protein [Agromyces mangrovi Wang et al. 2018]|uniref:intein-containing Rv2578c family radical SAM protein n=1 Tax=Agromyces mangrovi TaxID=1858653 RepID=UPI00257393C0|nr:intein-containing Rv2578c family radical SAM protein [Agromyces mangrovi]